MERDTRGKNHQVSFSCASCIIVQGEALARVHLAHLEGITVGQAACQNLLLQPHALLLAWRSVFPSWAYDG